MKRAGVAVVNLSMYRSMSSLSQDQDTELLCWNCHTVVDAHLCSNCGKIQPASQKNYFALLGLPISFSLDLDFLEKKYLQLQQLIHPDRFVGKSRREKHYATQQSSQLNQAYEALKDPVQRGFYLLKMQDRDYGEHAVGQVSHDPDFLMHLLMERESIESATDLGQIQESLAVGKEKLKTYEEAIRQSFEGQELEAALTYLTRHQYQQTLVERATQRLKQIRN
jgi:molecular chaperone HscB